MTQEILNQHTNALNPFSHRALTALALLTTAGTTAYYFTTMWPMRPIALTTATIPSGYGELVTMTLTILIATQLLLQAIFKVTHAPSISGEARRNGYFILTLGMLAAVGSVFLDELTPFCTANLALLGFGLAQIVKLASHLFYGRR